MNIIVLGGTGYLGSKVINKLINAGHRVACFKRQNSDLSKLEDIVEKIDFVNVENFAGFLKETNIKYDCFLNAACRYQKTNITEMDIWEANLNIPMKVFSECCIHGVKRTITVGTSLPSNLNVYAFSKRMFADVGKWYCDHLEENIEFCNIELENFYGKDEPQDRFIPSTITKLKNNEKILLTEGTQKRDYIHIDDVVNAIVYLIEKGKIDGYIDFPLGSGESVTIREMVEYLKAITKSESELCFGAVPKRKHEPDTKADCRLMNEYGVKIEHTWKQGFCELI